MQNESLSTTSTPLFSTEYVERDSENTGMKVFNTIEIAAVSHLDSLVFAAVQHFSFTRPDVTEVQFEFDGQDYVAVSSRPSPYTSTRNTEGTILDVLVIAPAAMRDEAAIVLDNEKVRSTEHRNSVRQEYSKFVEFLKEITGVDVLMGRGSYFDKQRLFVESADIDLLLFIDPKTIPQVIATLKDKLPAYCQSNPRTYLTMRGYNTDDVGQIIHGELRKDTAVFAIDIVPKLQGDDLDFFVQCNKPSTYEKNMFISPIVPICNDPIWFGLLALKVLSYQPSEPAK